MGSVVPAARQDRPSTGSRTIHLKYRGGGLTTLVMGTLASYLGHNGSQIQAG